MNYNHLLFKHAKQEDPITQILGEFLPFSYAIGLSYDPELDEKRSREDGTFSHEMMHLLQFTSTSIGLDALRLLNSAVRGLDELGGKKPSPPTYDFQTDDEETILSLSRLADLDFIVGRDLTPKVIPRSIHVERGFDPKIAVRCSLSHPSVELFRKAFPQEINSITDYKNTALSVGANPFVDYWVDLAWNGIPLSVHMNTASVLEACGAIAELTSNPSEHAISVESFLEHFFAKPPIYWIVLWYAADEFDLLGPYVLHKFLACADLCLLYTSMSQHSLAPTASLDEGAGKQINPIEVFLRCAEAAGKIADPGSHDRSELQALQDSISKAAGLPLAREMVNNNVAKAQSLCDQLERVTTDDVAPLRYSMPLTLFSQKFRASNFEGSYYGMTSRDYQEAWLREASGLITFYDVNSRETFGISRASFETVAWYQMIADYISGKAHTCPMKKGVPFYCWSKESENFCSYDEERKSPCPKLLFEHFFKSPSEEK